MSEDIEDSDNSLIEEVYDIFKKRAVSRGYKELFEDTEFEKEFLQDIRNVLNLKYKEGRLDEINRNIGELESALRKSKTMASVIPLISSYNPQ